MDIRQLKYFLAIVEEGSITKAAERLHIAQPPLSQQLKLLEAELGVKLVERNTRKLSITDAGKVLQRRAAQILDLAETTIKELRDVNEGLKGTLSIGAISSVGYNLLPKRIAKFHNKYPDIDFQIREQSTQEVIELLIRGVIEIGFIRTPYNYELFEAILLPDAPMVAAVNQDFVWSEQQDYICLTELADMPLLVHNRYERVIAEACRRFGFEPRILGKIDDTKSILLWADIGMGIAIVQKDWIDLLPNTNLKYKEINEPSLVTRTAIIWMKNRYLSAPTRHFLEYFKSEE